MFDNYYATEYQLTQKQTDIEKRARFAWMLTDLKDTNRKSVITVEVQPHPSCCPSV